MKQLVEQLRSLHFHSISDHLHSFHFRKIHFIFERNSIQGWPFLVHFHSFHFRKIHFIFEKNPFAGNGFSENEMNENPQEMATPE